MHQVQKSELSGVIRAPPSKSETHREIILSALSCGTSVLKNPLVSSDTAATLRGVQAFGAVVSEADGLLTITGGNLHAAESCIDCGNSGTTLRLLTGLASTLSGTTEFTGDSSLMHRPMQPLLSALEALGAEISVEKNIISVTGPAAAGTAEIRGDISSQFVSSLLTAGIPVKLTTPLVSAPYVDMTISALEKRGVRIEKTENSLTFQTPFCLRPREAVIEGDWTAASYLLAAGALSGNITVTGLNPESLQGDRRIIPILKSFGADVSAAGDRVTAVRSPLKGSDANLSDTPDLFPALSVLAACAEGTSRFYGVSRLIYKESDRVSGMSDILSKLGACVSFSGDCCMIKGGSIFGSQVSAGGDHRLFMAAVIAGLSAEGCTEISGDDEIYAVSYPDFLRDIRTLGGKIT